MGVLWLSAAAQPIIPILTPTPPSPAGAPPAITPQAAPITLPTGWSCDDFPCEDDLAGWLARLQVPPGFEIALYGQFPGQPQQIAFGPDGRLYGTVLENGTRRGSVYAMDTTGAVERITAAFESPVGLAFLPGTDILFVSSRTEEGTGALWRRTPDGSLILLIDDLPCCRDGVTGQPAGLTTGPDGFIYLGVSSLSDRAEPTHPQFERHATPQPYEASILRVQPQNGAIDVYAEGFREPYDLAFAPDGRLYAVDNGTYGGIGDRVLSVTRGGHYGFPFWRPRGCEDCPPTDFSLDIQPDLLPLPALTLPRGVAVYTGTQFPANYFGSVFVALWNGVPQGQRVIRIEPDRVPTDPELLAAFTPEPFVTGLIRPTDVAVAPDGSLLVADFIYGHVWRVRWTGRIPPTPTPTVTNTPVPVLFATHTPAP